MLLSLIYLCNGKYIVKETWATPKNLYDWYNQIHTKYIELAEDTISLGSMSLRLMARWNLSPSIPSFIDSQPNLLDWKHQCFDKTNLLISFAQWFQTSPRNWVGGLSPENTGELESSEDEQLLANNLVTRLLGDWKVQDRLLVKQLVLYYKSNLCSYFCILSDVHFVSSWALSILYLPV